MEHLSNDHENCPNPHENSHKLCNVVLSLMESQWKLRQDDQNFPMQGKPLQNILASEERNKPKRAVL